MKRRVLLDAVGVGAVAVAGGVGLGILEVPGSRSESPCAGDRSRATTDVDMPERFPPSSAGDLEAYDPGSTHASVELGNRDATAGGPAPHGVDVWNAVDRARDVRLRILEWTSGVRLLDETYRIPAWAEVSATLLEPSDYVVEVRLPAAGADEALSVPCHRFDCNHSSTAIGVFEDGEFRSRFSSTLALCE